MKENDQFSILLMDKLSGELSENDAKHFHNDLNDDESLKEEFAFFEQAWQEMDEISVPEASERLTNNFYNQLAAVQIKEDQSIKNRFFALKNQLLTSSPLARNLSFGMFLLAFGFILGGQFNTKKIEVSQLVQQPNENENYVLSTQKIQQVNAIQSNSAEKETIEKLKAIVTKEENTNVRLAALNQLSNYSTSDASLKKFFVQQIEGEQSPLIQVELLNLIIESSKTKESISTMENLLAKQTLNPAVQEKIIKDLPVLRASFVK